MTGFSDKQLRALRRPLSPRVIRTRQNNGRTLHFIEGWHAVDEANRIFGYDHWDRETIETKCVIARETKGTFLAVYSAKVRITVRAEGTCVVREGHGFGEARSSTPGEAHDNALKSAETDGTKRALATFGRPFGLSLYLSKRLAPVDGAMHELPESAVPQASQTVNETTSNPLPSVNILREGSERGTSPGGATHGSRPAGKIDKGQLIFGEPRRIRDRDHLRFVAEQPCLVCGRQPADAHHLKIAQPPAVGSKVSDEFTVPLCRLHHRELHWSRSEAQWWESHAIDALEIAEQLWLQNRNSSCNANGTNRRAGSSDEPNVL